jgi:tetratricopeptide (TPR) repeat protein
VAIQIRHLQDSTPPQFQLLNSESGKLGKVTADIPDPVHFPVEGWPDMPLLKALRWYLEKFLDYPFHPETIHAELVQKALKQWGELAFNALFGDRVVGGWLDAATAEAYADLHLQIVSDDPAVLAWPWEALYDERAGCRLAQNCQVERRLDGLADPPKAKKKLPKDRVNILLVIARPYERDVHFRSIARPLVEWASQPEISASVHVLRPPTFDQLRQHLHAHPGFYHILHFDGHGAYGITSPAGGGQHTFQAQGKLVFEKGDGSPDPIPAETLSELLRENALPAVVLNACQSAMVDQRADDPFASVAAALLKAGMRSVTAMAYSLYVSGAREFLPAFYRRLFENGQVPDAARAGRQQMFRQRERVCARGTFPLEDWLVPVLYQQAEPDFRFVKKASSKDEAKATRLPDAARESANPYGFFGRDGAILNLERALRRKPVAIVINGLDGVGKTTLARGFLQWLDQTGGLPDRVLWLSFADIRGAEYVFNRIGESFYGPNFAAADMAQKLGLLEEACRQHPLLMVWDNFESARGIPGSAIAGNLTEQDCGLLRDFLSKLYGSSTKVLITSRSTEEWLTTENRYLLALGGLDGEERWEFANAILHERGLRIDRGDPAISELMNLLNGHPLAMRVILLRLEKQQPADLLAEFRKNLGELESKTSDATERHLFAPLRLVTEALPAAWKPLLIALAQHEGFVQSEILELMARQVDPNWTLAKINDCLGALANGGLLREIQSGLWEMHPAVTGYWHSAYHSDLAANPPNAWVRAFVDVLSSLADQLAPRPLHEQRGPFQFHGANFHSARSSAKRLGMEEDYAALTQGLAVYAQNTFAYDSAERLFQELAEHNKRVGREKNTASAYHQLGRIARERRDLDDAQRWYQKALDVFQRFGDEHSAAIVLGSLARLSMLRNTPPQPPEQPKETPG